jgi:DNA-binding transcriptional MerR regulator
MDKDKNNPIDLLTVTEFSKLVGIPTSKLRYYARRGVFIPAAYGDGKENRYRYYFLSQITTVKMIRVLTEIGVSLNTIKDLTDDRTPEKLIKLLAKNKRIIEDEMKYLNEVYSIMNVFHDLLIEGISAEENDIIVCEMPEMPIILGESTNFANHDGFIIDFLAFCNTPRKPRLNLSYPIGGYFTDMEAFLRSPSEPTRFFSFDPNGYERKEQGLYLVGYTRGYYGKTNNLPQRMEDYAKKHNIIFNGPVYNIFLFDELSTLDPEQYLLQVTASITKTQHTLSHHPHHHFKNAL